MQIGYRAVEVFAPSTNDSWAKYIEWSGLRHLSEVVGLDLLLCPAIEVALGGDDLSHMVFAEIVSDCFDSPQYAMSRVRSVYEPRRHQLLAIARQPVEADFDPRAVPGFRFLGFELIEELTMISALTNCGGFEGAFTADDLSVCGLVRTWQRANEIRDALARLYPAEPHAQCTPWAIWRDIRDPRCAV